MAQKRKNPTKAQQAKRKSKFQQKLKNQVGQMNKMQKIYQQQMMMRQDIVRRASIVEGILNARPEFATEVDGKLVLNENEVYLNDQDNVLYWKSDNNPVVSGLESFENYSKFSPDFVNEVLGFISAHRNRQQVSPTTDVSLEDFDLVEDETFTTNETSNDKTE